MYWHKYHSLNPLTSELWMRKCRHWPPQCTDSTYSCLPWLSRTRKSPSFFSSSCTSRRGWHRDTSPDGPRASPPRAPAPGRGNLVRCIKYTTLQEEVAHTAMSKEQGGGERGRLTLKNTNRILGLEQAAEMAHDDIYVEELMVLQDQTMNNTIAWQIKLCIY